MSWASMAAELTGVVPVPFPYAKTLVNRAWLDVQRSFLWSFLYFDAAIPSIIPVTAGVATPAIGSKTVSLDASAVAALTPYALNTLIPLATLQFRIGSGTFYNITAFDATARTLTLDRLWADPLNGGTYQVLSVYFNAPYADFVWWESITDPVTGYSMDMTLTREEADASDPQRLSANYTKGPIPYRINPQPGNFLNYPMYEFWPAPINGFTFVGTGWRRGALFTADADTVSPPLGEDVVMAKAKMYGYEWAVANPDKAGKGDFKFAYGAAQIQYEKLLNGFILTDEEFSHRHRIEPIRTGYVDALPWVSQKTMSQFAP